MKWPTVMCAMCNKPVDRMEFFDDHINDQQVLRVRCHGDWDEMRLSSLEVTYEAVEQINNSVGTAFTTKRLEAT